MAAIWYTSTIDDPPYLDLRNVPKDKLTVTVSVDDSDEKLKKIIEKRLESFKKAKEKAVKGNMWLLAARLTERINVLREVLKEYERD